MALASWSTRRIATLWIAGLALQTVILAMPVLLARHLIASSGDVLRVGAEQDARWRIGDAADSLSLANQRARVRMARTYSIDARGDTIFPLVHVPSGRPDPAVVADIVKQARREARVVTILMIGLMPALLLGITLVWMLERRKGAGAGQTFGSA